MKEEIRKLLQHYFSEELGEGADTDIADEIISIFQQYIDSNRKMERISEEKIAEAILASKKYKDKTYARYKAVAQAQLDQDKQEVIYWRGLLESVMCEIYADGLTDETEKKVMDALKEKK